MPRRETRAERRAASLTEGHRRFARIFEKARDELALQVLKAFGLRGGVRTLTGEAAPSTQDTLGYQLRRIQQTVKVAGELVNKLTDNVLPEVYLDAANAARVHSDLSPVSKIERLGDPELHYGTIEAQKMVVVQGLTDALIESGRFAGRWVNSVHLDPELRGRVQEAFTGALFKADTRKEAADAIFSVLNEVGDARAKEAADAVAGKFIQFGNGAQFDLASYSEMVADTRMSELYNRGQVVAYGEAGYGLVQITVRNTDCDICAPYEATVWAIGEDAVGQYRPLRECMNYGPPFHPNCRHQVVGVDFSKDGGGRVRVQGAMERVQGFRHTEASQAARDRQQRAIASPVRVPVKVTYAPERIPTGDKQVMPGDESADETAVSIF